MEGLQKVFDRVRVQKSIGGPAEKLGLPRRKTQITTETLLLKKRTIRRAVSTKIGTAEYCIAHLENGKYSLEKLVHHFWNARRKTCEIEMFASVFYAM